jgi:hypothetical protein
MTQPATFPNQRASNTLSNPLRSLDEIITRMLLPIPRRLIAKKDAGGGARVDYINITTQKDLMDWCCGRGHWRAEVVSHIILPELLGLVVRVWINTSDQGWLSHDGTGTAKLSGKMFGDPLTNAYAQAVRRGCESFNLARELWRRSIIPDQLEAKRLLYQAQQTTEDIPQAEGDEENEAAFDEETVERAESNHAGAVTSTEPTPPADKRSTSKVATLRDKRAQGIAAMGLVTRNGNHYDVQTPAPKGKSQTYQVERDEAGKVHCTCAEFKKEVKSDPTFRCEHILAVKHSLLIKSQPSESSSSQATETTTTTEESPAHERTEKFNRTGRLATIEDARLKLEKADVAPGWTQEALTLYVNEKYEVEGGINDESLTQAQLKEISYYLWNLVDEHEKFKAEHQQPAQRTKASAETSSITFPRNPVAKSMAELVTPKQLGLLRARSREVGVDAEEECQRVLGCKPDELSKKAASSFIEYLGSLEQ